MSPLSIVARATREPQYLTSRRGTPRAKGGRSSNTTFTIATADLRSRTMVRATTTCLPPSLPPRGLSRAQAAEYIGVGVTKFDEMVGDGRMPRPMRIDGRTVWDRIKLDEAFDALDNEAAKSEWDRL